MRPGWLNPWTVAATPQVAGRAALGAGVMLLVLHSLAARIPRSIEPPSVIPEQVRLRLDPNVATREELMLLPRIGPKLADYIIEYRESVAPECAFDCAEDLVNVHRIGPLTVARLRPLLWFPPVRSDDVNAEAHSP